jgi:2-oxoisovalerate dehydrogenase E1 component
MLSVPETRPMPIDKNAVRFFRAMVLIRRVEESFLALFREGLLSGTTHPCIGQEASAVGCCAAIERDDVVTSTHRGHGHYLAHTGDIGGLAAEVLGRETGCCGGRGGSQHLQQGSFYTNGLTGGMVPGATGMALAEQRAGRGRAVMAFLGDGAMGQGCVYEAMNMAALWKLPIVYACEVNRFAMSTRVEDFAAGDFAIRAEGFGVQAEAVDGQDVFAVAEAAKRAVDAARAGKGPRFLVIKTYRFLGHSKSDDLKYRDAAEAAPWLARDPIALVRGMIPAAEAERIEKDVAAEVAAAVERAKAAPAPKPESLTEHVFLERSQGSEARRPEKEKKQPDSRLLTPGSSPPLVVEEIRRALRTAMGEDERVVLIGEDLRDPYGGAFKCSLGLFKEFGERVINTPVSEAGIAGLAFGAALRGLVPVAEIMFGDFVTLASDQIINHAAKYPWMCRGRTAAPLTIRTPMGGRRGYGPTHSQSIEKLLLGVPGLTVVAASQAHDVFAVTLAAIRDPNPVVLIENKSLYGIRLGAGLEKFKVTMTDGPYPAAVIRTDAANEPVVTLVCYGGMLPIAAKACAQIAGDVSIEIVGPSLLAPLDDGAILESFKRTGRLVIVEESSAACGFGAEVAARAAEKAYEYLRAPVRRVTASDTPVPCAKGLEDAALPQAEDIVEAILGVMEE